MTGASEAVQFGADRRWFPIGAARRPHLKAVVYVVARVRAVDLDGTWHDDDRGYADIPVTAVPTTRSRPGGVPMLGLRLDGARPHVRGKISEYIPL